MQKSDEKFLFESDQLLEAIEIFNREASIEHVLGTKSVREVLNKSLECLNVKVATYHHIPGLGTYDFTNMSRYIDYNIPIEIKSFLDQRGRVQDDPGMLATFSSGEPIWISDMINHDLVKGTHHETNVRQCMELIGDGLLLALFGPMDRKGYAFIGFQKDKENFHPLFAWQVHSFLQMAHVRYCLMLTELQKQVNLTKRETDVLELIAFGKTNPEIGMILDITANTVAGYVKRIFLKLGTTDRVTTAMRARSLDIIR